MTMARNLTAIMIGAFSLYFISVGGLSIKDAWEGGTSDWSADLIVIGCTIVFAAVCLVAIAKLPPEFNSVRSMEFYMAALMGIFSIYLMQKSVELPIWWIKGLGPGGGAWSFWLAAIMYLSILLVLWNWFRGRSPQSQSEEVYMDNATLIDVGQVALALTITIALFHFIGVYGALPLFLIFYARFFGQHSWRTTAHMTYNTVLLTFWFFELALNITLPKGMTDDIFQLFYTRLYALEWYEKLVVFSITMLPSLILELIYFVREKSAQ